MSDSIATAQIGLSGLDIAKPSQNKVKDLCDFGSGVVSGE